MRRTLARILLSTSVFASPLCADRANDVAREYLTIACAEGKERVGVYDASLDAFVDLTAGSDTEQAMWDADRLLQYCADRQLVMYHCHTTNDLFSAFPSPHLDIPLAANIEYDCATYGAEHDTPSASIVHRLIPIPGDGSVVEYGLTEPLARIRGLGIAHGNAARAQKQDIASRKEDRNRAEAMRWIRDTISNRFAADLQGFMHASCPDANTPQEFSTCGAITLERFLQTRTGDEQYHITVQRAPPRAVTLQEALGSTNEDGGAGEEFLLWRARPRVMIFSGDLRLAQAALGRISYFVEVEPGKIPRRDAAHQNAAGYDLTSEDIARFYNAAQESNERLQPEEERLRDALVSYGVLQQVDARWAGTAYVLITVPTKKSFRREVFLHEVSHALYFTDERYRQIADEFQQRSMSATDVRVVTQSLAAFGYDIANAHLMRNETQAYLAADGLFSLVATARNVAPTTEILRYIVERNCELPFEDCPLISLAREYRQQIAPYFEGLLDAPPAK